MRRFIISALVLSAVTANAQVKDGMIGINTDEPRATMHIEPGVSESKGLIIPRITAAQMKTMTNLAHFGADHHAIITYLKEQLPTADRTGKLADVAAPGYYYYDNTTGVQKWKTFGGGAEQDFKALPTFLPGEYNYLTKGAGIGGNGTDLGTGYGNIGIGSSSFSGFANSSDMSGNNNIGMGISLFQFSNGGAMWSNNNIGIGGYSYTFQNGGSIEVAGYNIGMGNGLYTFNKSNARFSGGQNTAIGESIFNLTNGDLTGYSNIGMGGSVYNLTSGNMAGVQNTAIGQSIFNLVNGDFSGYNNIGIGSSLYHLTSGNMEGSNNIGIGQNSYSVVNGNITNTAKNNISLGIDNYRLTNTSGATFSGANNIGIGNNLYYVNNNLTGNRNIGMGDYTFKATGDFAGSSNIGFGSSVLSAVGNVTGNANIGMGGNALSAMGNVSGNFNIALGYSAMNVFATGNMTGDNNIALGYQAYSSNGIGGLTGGYNVAIGYQALRKGSGTAGSDNVAVGNTAGIGLVLGSGNVHIGSRNLATDTPGEPDNVVFLGSGINPFVPIEDNTIIIGHAGTTNATKVGMGTYQPKAKLDVNGGVRVANDASACSSANEGTIRYDGTNFYGCTSSGWKQLNN